MKNKILLLLVLFTHIIHAQTGTVLGIVNSKVDATVLEFVSLQIEELEQARSTNAKGEFLFENIPYGNYTLLVAHLGYESQRFSFHVDEAHSIFEIDVLLEEVLLETDRIVVTGTKTFKRQTNSPVIVNVIDSKTLGNVQACNLSDGLKFQPGLRVETDCQTCNYTQLRMNGLGGGYSQILINGRPIFSPLTGLYGMEQIPVNMIDRIEVVRGGGSALYGSSAIGGTVNVITKIPKKNSYNIGYTYQNINAKASDHILTGNATVLTAKKNAGASFFINNRNRDYYDHNGDDFSELPQLKNTALGTSLFFLPTENQKLELSLSYLNEYRYGGEMVDKPAYLTQQSEERTHNVWMGSADYQINFNDDNSSIIAYVAGQNTTRKHYTGIIPDDSLSLQNHLENPPYGTSDVVTLQVGTQYNHRFKNFLKGTMVMTAGAEFTYDKVNDEIASYNYLIDQTTTNMGLFLQSDWEIIPSLNLLAGVRADKHNLVNQFIFSPRVALLYKLKNTTQFRVSWGTGFRAPQAFDADLHIAFAGGGISRISLDPNLLQENSNSVSASVNYDKATNKYVFGFTLEGFYTYLNNAFYQHALGEDSFGELFEKRNGDGATVMGGTVELRLNYDKKVQMETGFTYQSSKYDSPIAYSDILPSRQKFLRTPDWYGFATLSIMPIKNFNTAINFVYTGPMSLVHLAGAPEQMVDEYVTSPIFAELGIKTGYTFDIKKLDLGIEVFGGIKNIFNSYQNDFDSGKNRDSNYIYGTAAPRMFFVGLNIKSL